MTDQTDKFAAYFEHLGSISRLGRLYKRYFSSVLLFLLARRFGTRMVEVGAGVGNGMLGAFPGRVVGLDINPLAVEYAQGRGLNAHLIHDDGSYPFADGAFDACILDNVLEHIEHPQATLDECFRITASGGGLVIVVPGQRGYESDPDHKVYYDEARLRMLDERWKLLRLVAMPSLFLSRRLSDSMRQYCLVAVYRKQ